MAYNVAGGGNYSLNGSIGSTDTTLTLSSFTEPVSGVPYTMTLLNTSIAYATIAPKTSSSEFVSFTGITQNLDGTATITGVVRGLAKKYPFTSSSTFQLPHSGQSVFILSDAPQVFNQFASLANDETFTGLITFTQTPIGINPGGQPDASTTVKGIGRVSVAPVSPTIPIFVGQNDPIVPTQGENDALVGNNTEIVVGTGNKFVTQTGLIKSAENYGVTTGSANAYVLTLSPVVTSYGNMSIRFTTNFANTGSATINVNSLGAKTLQINGVVLTSGQLANGSTYTATYDGTNFQITSPVVIGVAFTAAKNGISSQAPSVTPTTIAHGLGLVPKLVTLQFFSINTFGTILDSIGSFTSGSQAANYVAEKGSSGSSPALGSTTTYSIFYGVSGNGSVNTASWGGVVSVDVTNITITWTQAGSPGTPTLSVIWTAQG